MSSEFNFFIEALRHIGTWGGYALAILISVFVLGIMKTQRKCAKQAENCRKDLLNKVAQERTATNNAFEMHRSSCPNTLDLAKLEVGYSGEIKRIHERVTEVADDVKGVREEVKKEMQAQRTFLDALASRVINSQK